jgi:hypothetical protein
MWWSIGKPVPTCTNASALFPATSAKACAVLNHLDAVIE